MTDLRKKVARAPTNDELLDAFDKAAVTLDYDHPDFRRVARRGYDEARAAVLARMNRADAALAAMPMPSPQREVYAYRDGVMHAEMEPVPQSASGKVCCTLCETPLDQPSRPWTRDCGGDCLACMADVGDPDCVAALAAMPGGGVGAGWKLVPENATPEMRRAGGASRNIIGDAAPIYRAMLAAAPTPPAAAEETE